MKTAVHWPLQSPCTRVTRAGGQTFMPSHSICNLKNWTLNPSPGLITGRFQCRDMGACISVWHIHFHKPLLISSSISFHTHASFLWTDKWPLIKTARCPPPVVRSSSDILGENQMDSHKFYASCWQPCILSLFTHSDVWARAHFLRGKTARLSLCKD